MMSMNYDVIVAGHICLDVTPKIPGKGELDIAGILKPGKLLKVGDAVISTGGAVSNTGIALSKLGCKTGFMSSVGNDEFGDIIIEKMAKYGSVEGFVRNENVGSSYSVILAIPSIDRIILHNSGCNDYFTAENINWEIVSSARLFHLGYPPIMKSLFRNNGVELANILKTAKTMGVSTSLDMALTEPTSEAGQIDWPEWFGNVLPHVDFFMPSIEEMLFFLDRTQWEKYRALKMDFVDAVPVTSYCDISKQLLDFGCRVAFLKAGDRGIYLKSSDSTRMAEIKLIENDRLESWSNRELWGASYEIETIISATGAGDSAVAGILAALLQGKSAGETLRWGNCLGYQNLRALDTVSGIGTYEETDELLTNLTPASADFLDDSWNPISSSDIWERKQDSSKN